MAHKRFATSLVAACLVSTCLAYGAFANDPSLYFYPTQKWTVAQAGDEGAAASCTLSNQFNNGFGIFIRGTAAGLGTLDIDFRQSSFEIGKRYEVVYSVPGQSREIIQATARTGSLLSTDISARGEFSSALKSAATLDLSIQGNDFRLYLTGFAKAMDEYRDCLSPPATMAAIDEVESPPELFAADAEVITASASSPFDSIIEQPSSNSLVSAPSSQAEQKSGKDDIVAKAASLADNYKAERSSASLSPEPLSSGASAQVEGDAFFDIEGADAASDLSDLSADLPPLDDPAAASAQPKPQTRGPRYTETLAKELSDRSEQYKPQTEDSRPRALNASASSSTDTQSEPAASQTRGGPSGDILKTKDDVIFFGETPPAQTSGKESAAQGTPPTPAPKKASSTPYPTLFQDAAPAKPEPQKTSVTIPAYKMTKQTSSMEADFTDVGLAESETAMNDAPSMDRIAAASAALEPSSGQAGEDFIQMRDKIRELEVEVGRLSKENSNLDNELKTSLKDSEDERLSVSSDNWNLERATMRFNEAERQLQRLGRQLQAARQQCTQEKQELETMLFDPQVTEQQQLAKLSSLEQELAKAQTELNSAQRRYEERIRILEGQLAAQ